jgi:hypothetical protein
MRTKLEILTEMSATADTLQRLIEEFEAVLALEVAERIQHENNG